MTIQDTPFGPMHDQMHERYQESLAGFGLAMAESDVAMAQMTPREQAEAAWTPTSTHTVNELEDRIRAGRGLWPLDRGEA